MVRGCEFVFIYFAGNGNLRTGTGWRVFFQFFRPPPPVHMIFLEKSPKSFLAVMFSPVKIYQGTRYWYANFSSLFLLFQSSESASGGGTEGGGNFTSFLQFSGHFLFMQP